MHQLLYYAAHDTDDQRADKRVVECHSTRKHMLGESQGGCLVYIYKEECEDIKDSCTDKHDRKWCRILFLAHMVSLLIYGVSYIWIGVFTMKRWFKWVRVSQIGDDRGRGMLILPCSQQNKSGGKERGGGIYSSSRQRVLGGRAKLGD